jgi:DNA adenine methylase
MNNMTQCLLLENPDLSYSKTSNVVNVSSVPQRSPFRYPGGKTWLVPRIRQWFGSLPIKPARLVEPFAGGGIVSLTVAFEDLAGSVTMVERDDQVAAVWHTILNNDNRWLADKIVDFDLTVENIQAVLSELDQSVRQKAFRTILRNRINHGGILAPGSGLLKRGENGKGIQSRWYPETLRKRILNIATVKDRITFIEGDGLAVLRNELKRPNDIFFIDPPYTASGKKAGSRLYTHSELDHEELFRLAAALKGDFLMTYDYADGVIDLARKHDFDIEAIAMKNTHHTHMSELLIGRDLDWARRRNS